MGGSDSYFDQLLRDFARGGSRRDFVRRTAGLWAVFTFGRAGLSAAMTRPVTSFFGLPDPCKSPADCKPCEACSPTGEQTPQGHIGICVSICSGCEICDGKQCKNNCPTCKRCNKYAGDNGECVADQILESQCKSCDEKTGEIKDICTPCEKCDRGYCQQNCPGRCEVCEEGKCRKCKNEDCEVCDEGTGTCLRCDPVCERCNEAGACVSTCEGGMTCCFGQCLDCCRECDPKSRLCLGFGAGQGGTCLDTYTRPACCADRQLGYQNCVDLDSDLKNCGQCEEACGFQQHCRKGRCVCEPGRIKRPDGSMETRGGGMECGEQGRECCNGECVAVSSYQSDPKHCGKCIVECEKDEKCVKGECVGSKRRGYSLLVVQRVISSNLGVERSVTMKAVVRELDTPDADGNTFAGKGSYDGWARRYNPSCDNKGRTAHETIPLSGEARGGGNADDLGGGQISLVFTITPLNPPENLPEAVLPALGDLVLTGGAGKSSSTFKLQSDKCRGTLTHTMEWSAQRIK